MNFFTLILLAFLISFTSAQCGMPSGFEFNGEFLDGRLRFHWTLDSDLGILRVGMAAQTNGWVGMGISKTDPATMIDSEAVMGWRSQSAMSVRSYRLPGKDEASVVNNDASIPLDDVYACKFIDSGNIWVFANFSRSITSGNNKIRLDGTTPIILAYGTQSAVSQHGPNARVATSINLVTGKIVNKSDLNAKHIAHGVLMFVGFALLILAGSIFARFGRGIGGRWVHIHYIVQIIGYIIGFVGFVLAMIMVNRAHFKTKAHSQLGIAVITAAMVQLIIGFIRPDKAQTGQKKSKKRLVWEIVHVNLGRIINIVTIVTVFFGFHQAGAHYGFYIAYGIFVGIAAIIVISLEIRARCAHRKYQKQMT